MDTPTLSSAGETRRADLIIPPDAPKDAALLRKRKKRELPPPKPTGILGYLSLIFIILAVFSPIFLSDVVWSEYDEVERSAFQSMDHWSQAWSIESIRKEDPITLTSYFLESAIPLPDAIVHHALNLLLHIIGAILLVRTLEALQAPAALPAALIFALHPVVVETLFWSGYRNEIVGLIFILSALLMGIRSRNTQAYIATLFLSAIACIVHPAALAIPVILALVTFFQERYFTISSLNRILPLICITLFIGVWTQIASPKVENQGISESISFLNTAGNNLYYYLRQAVVPFELSLFTPVASAKSYQVGSEFSLLPFFLFIPFIALLVINRKKPMARAALLGLISYLILCIYGISQTGVFINGEVAQVNYGHYVALPAIISLLICGAAAIARRTQGAGKLFLILGLSFIIITEGALTASYNYAIGDPIRMWQSFRESWPQAWQPKAALIEKVIAEESELLDSYERISLLESLLAIKPDLHAQRILYARTLRDAGQQSNAQREYKRVLRETQPSNELLEEAADFYQKIGLKWEATNARSRIAP